MNAQQLNDYIYIGGFTPDEVTPELKEEIEYLDESDKMNQLYKSIGMPSACNYDYQELNHLAKLLGIPYVVEIGGYDQRGL